MAARGPKSEVREGPLHSSATGSTGPIAAVKLARTKPAYTDNINRYDHAGDFMRCRVYPLRRRGRRLPWREVANASSFD